MGRRVTATQTSSSGPLSNTLRRDGRVDRSAFSQFNADAPIGRLRYGVRFGLGRHLPERLPAPMNRLRVFLALCVLVISAATAAGCGGVPGDSAATVDGEPIEMQSLDHWMTVAAKTNGQPNAQVPKPPHYAPCIEQKRKTQPKPGKGDSKPTDTQLKRHCAQEYEGLRN